MSQTAFHGTVGLLLTRQKASVGGNNRNDVAWDPEVDTRGPLICCWPVPGPQAMFGMAMRDQDKGYYTQAKNCADVSMSVHWKSSSLKSGGTTSPDHGTLSPRNLLSCRTL